MDGPRSRSSPPKRELVERTHAVEANDVPRCVSLCSVWVRAPRPWWFARGTRWPPSMVAGLQGGVSVGPKILVEVEITPTSDPRVAGSDAVHTSSPPTILGWPSASEAPFRTHRPW